MKFFGMKAAAPADARPVLARAWGTGAVVLGEWPAIWRPAKTCSVYAVMVIH